MAALHCMPTYCPDSNHLQLFAFCFLQPFLGGLLTVVFYLGTSPQGGCCQWADPVQRGLRGHRGHRNLTHHWPHQGSEGAANSHWCKTTHQRPGEVRLGKWESMFIMSSTLLCTQILLQTLVFYSLCLPFTACAHGKGPGVAGTPLSFDPM